MDEDHELHYDAEYERSPNYEAEDIGCYCVDIESEWEWNTFQSCYICTGCGAIQ